MMLLRKMAEKEKMAEKLNDATALEEHGQVEQNRSMTDKFTPLNICMLTQKLVMMFLTLQKPKVLHLSVAMSVIHGVDLTENQRVGCMQKLWDVSKILQVV